MEIQAIIEFVNYKPAELIYSTKNIKVVIQLVENIGQQGGLI